MDKKNRVLIVDDEMGARYVLKELLSREDYDLDLAVDGPEALAQIDKQPPDVILLDVMMPIMNGFEVCQTLKADERWRHIPVIFLTALSNKKELARAFEVGADDFLSKPFNDVELSARIRSMLRIKTQYDLLEKQKQELEASLHVKEELAQITAQRLEELELLYKVGLNLMNSLDANYMVGLIVQTALKLIFKANHCVVHFLSDNEQHLMPFVLVDEAKTKFTEPNVGNERIIQHAIDTKEAVYIPNLPTDTTFPDLEWAEMCTVLVLPLVVDERVIGALSLDSPEADAFDVADRRILSILGNQLAISIMKAWLFENLGRNLVDDALLFAKESEGALQR